MADFVHNHDTPEIGIGMAGDWIKMRHNLETDPDVLRIAHYVNVDRFSVVGRLHAIWTWADQHSIDGCAVSATSSFLDELVCCTGFCDAMRKVGWLSGRDWDLEFPNFGRHNGETAKKRGNAAKAMAKKRCATRATNVAQTAQPEKRREEKSKSKPPLSPLGEVREFDSEKWPYRSDEFLAAWTRWLDHVRNCLGRDMPTKTDAQLMQLFALRDEGKAVAWISHSMSVSAKGNICDPEAFAKSAKGSEDEAAREKERKSDQEARHRQRVEEKRKRRKEANTEEQRRQELASLARSRDE